MIYHQSCLHNGVSRLVNASTCWEDGTAQLYGDRSAYARYTSRPHPMYLFIWLFIRTLYKILYNKLERVSKVFP